MTDPTDDDNAPNRYVLTASIDANGSLQLTGEGLRNNEILVPRGEDAVVKIKDMSGMFLYGAEIAPRGERPGCWARNTTAGLTRRKFEAVSQDVHNIVFAASTTSTASITYGPVISIKPKG